MKTITETAAMLNITRDKLITIIKNEDIQLHKGEKFFQITDAQLSYLIEKYKIEYIYIESKMNEPEPDTREYYTRQGFIDKGFIICN